MQERIRLVVEMGKKTITITLSKNYLNQDKFSDEIRPANYISFHNGGALFLSNILIDSLASLFRNDNISRVKIAKFFTSEKYQNLRVKLGISAMKTIASFVSCRQSISASNNKGLNLDPSCITIFVTKFIPLFQLLIGIKCNEKEMNNEFCLKEFFAFEFAREFGLFDDFSSKDYDDENVNEKQKQMLYSFLYMTLVFVCDRNVFCLDSDKFTEEQIIFALKQEIHSIDKLSKCYDNRAQKINSRLDRFNDILVNVASINKKR